MAWKDPYAILGVGRAAPLSEIKRAYRKLAFSAHPDIGDNPDAQGFREVHEAYETLNEMEQRRPRRIKVVRAPDRSGYAGTTQVEPCGRPEPIRRRRPVNIIDDFGIVSPSVGEILDHIAQNFFGFHQKSHGSCQRLGVDIVLTRARHSSASPCRSRCPYMCDVADAEAAAGSGACARYAMEMGKWRSLIA
jgi:DnaJ-class molecular chaperone